jgi:hypothetical protein
MFHTSSTNTLAAAYLGAGLITLLALPAAASAFGDDTRADEATGVDVGYAKHGNVEAHSEDPDDPPANWRRLLNEIDTPLTTDKHRQASRTDRSHRCPPPPDVRFVGVPWVPAVPTGCPTLDRWWRFVQVAGGDCVFDQQYLPHTADAVDGWYRSCRGRQ